MNTKEQTPLHYTYFVSYATTGGKVSNIVFNRKDLIRTAEDIKGIEDLIAAKMSQDPAAADDVGVIILSYRLLTESEDVISWAFQAFPVMAQLVAEAETIPNNHTWFSPENLDEAKRLVNFSPDKQNVPIQEEAPTGPVDAKPAVESPPDITDPEKIRQSENLPQKEK